VNAVSYKEKASAMFELTKTFIRILILSGFFALFSGCSTAPTTPSPQLSHKSDSLGDFIVVSAKSQLGKRYKYGGESPQEGFDCSGLAMYSYQANGIAIPRQTNEQFKRGTQINKTDLRNGDLVFFSTYRSGASHVGIYMGDGLFIHSPNKGKNVRVETLNNPYYKKHYIGARRYW